MRIHQIVAGYREFDAISNVANLLRGVFLSWGCKSEIFCAPACVAPNCRSSIRALATLPDEVSPEDIALLHLSIGCEANSVFAGLRCRKVIVYHNITPPEYFAILDRATAASLEEGRRQVRSLAGVADLNLAVSAFNAAELEKAGYRDVRVFPLPIDIDSLSHRGGYGPNNIPFDHKGGHFNILFVGRFAPNKKIEDLVKVFWHLEKIEPRARLFQIGAKGMDVYSSVVSVYVQMLHLQSVHFLDVVPQEALNAAYDNADAFLCMSEHEGFCAPLVEAMLHNVPVFALATSAVPETLGGAGVLFGTPPDYPVIAETISTVLNSPRLKASIVRRQEKRIAEIRSRDVSAELSALLKPLL